MADRVILDFENNTIEWDTDHQKGIEMCLDLAERKKAILVALGYSQVDLAELISEFSYCLKEADSDRIYGYTLDEWNSMSEDQQIAIETKHEYDLQHPEQRDWFVD